ncbi:pyruvate kinase [Halosquirtibacter laminarini]|uniref:Pyruvate kinase n=1 Tax=Halosquirtibacter laminarini TaxID=3374600 RepID=A0AC61NJQ5_9BACT|nr:pyruvate kinase [Prolixibacteraceae bacterium]
MKKHTKIVATISDRKCEPEFIRELHEAGMNVVRINTAHQMPEDTERVIKNIREVSDKIAILVDTKGPEIRTKNVENPISVKSGDKVIVKGGEGESKDNVLFLDYAGIANDVPAGSSLLIDDGELELKVEDVTEEGLVTVVCNDGAIKNRKSVNVPGVTITLPAITAKDKKFIEWSAENDIDFIAHSFVRNAADVLAVQEILDSKNSKAKIIAKIENHDGVQNVDEILDHAYGVMVARGDLGIEVPASMIPGIQRSLVRTCVSRKKPVIIATQMLHTMIENPRPTRAEVSDVANAIYQNTDAIMLSGETAYGDYPVEAVKVMTSIAQEVEAAQDRTNNLDVNMAPYQVPAFLAEAAVKAANQEDLDVKAIVTDSMSGRTARYLAAFRCNKPVLAKCHTPNVMRELALSYGVYADVIKGRKNKDKLVKSVLKGMVEDETLVKEDNVVYVGGSFGAGAGTTFMEIGSVEQLTSKNKKDQDAE